MTLLKHLMRKKLESGGISPISPISPTARLNMFNALRIDNPNSPFSPLSNNTQQGMVIQPENEQLLLQNTNVAENAPNINGEDPIYKTAGGNEYSQARDMLTLPTALSTGTTTQEPSQLSKAMKVIGGGLKKGYDALGTTNSDKYFNVMNAANMAKGFLGRKQKPPDQRYVERDSIIDAARGMNQYAKQNANQQIRDNLATTASANTTTDPRLNALMSLSGNADANTAGNQLNVQDASMYEQSLSNQTQQREAENIRKLTYERGFKGQQDATSMQNYQNQQAAAQNTINSALTSKYQQLKDKDNRAATQANEDKLLNASIYAQAQQRASGEIDYKMDANGDYVVTLPGPDGTLVTETVPKADTARLIKMINAAKQSDLIHKRGVALAAQDKLGFTNFVNGINDIKEQGGRMERLGSTQRLLLGNSRENSNIRAYTSMMRLAEALNRNDHDSRTRFARTTRK